ncbi:E3 ubiquitin-protein ligase RNF130-like [Salvia hispanica]|uniref:E3 ubiquitin-protein ligase RNF130-like n=1 Tax=Salvia hispanica TaxID=49212 RepID=UPI0020099166|nr:E3 ubiquitin-protein ligase RNF130-like [Salvia hispanica]
MASYRNRATWYDRSMLQSDETIFVIPPNQSRHRSSNWYDCSMLQGDDTIFLVPRIQSRRFVAAADGHDRNQLGVARRRRMMIAEHMRSKLVVRDHSHRDDDDDDDDDGLGVCVICQDNLNLVAQNHKIVRLDCAHYYHPRCITNWLNVKNTCPLCQAPVV